MRLLLGVFFILIVALKAEAQRDVEDEAGWSPAERSFLGIGLGGFGIGTSNVYGSYFTIGVIAQGGYMLTKKLSVGVGGEYQYTNYSDLKITNQVFGGYPFIRFNVFKEFFIQTDYDFYNIKTDARYSQRQVYERFFVGAGFASPAGRGGRFNLLVSYDMLYTSSSVFNTPLSIRAYFTFPLGTGSRRY